MDLISREKAIKAIRNLWSEAWGSLDDEQTYETNEYAKGLLDAIDAVDDVFGEERTDKTMIDKPMNPYAAEDFRNAMKEASEDMSKKFEDFSEDLKRIGEQMKVNAEEGVMSFIDFDDIPTEYSGIMRLPTSALWESLVDTLTDNGYEVIVRKEDATEVEREVDGADKFVVIEYGEVE